MAPNCEPGARVGTLRSRRLGASVLIAFAVDKSLWDWLGLLIVPVMLAIGGYLFNSLENRAAQEAEEQRARRCIASLPGQDVGHAYTQ